MLLLKITITLVDLHTNYWIESGLPTGPLTLIKCLRATMRIDPFSGENSASW